MHRRLARSVVYISTILGAVFISRLARAIARQWPPYRFLVVLFEDGSSPYALVYCIYAFLPSLLATLKVGT